MSAWRLRRGTAEPTYRLQRTVERLANTKLALIAYSMCMTHGKHGKPEPLNPNG